jgi:nucleoside-diphosphate-sugar epimerase
VRVLVLGGTHHVGRAVVEAALRRGDSVTTVTRGVSGPPASGARAVYADRTHEGALGKALDGNTWDAVIDTWSAAPRVVVESARLLAGRVGHYGYVSSRSVYAWPIPVGLDESAPVVDADPCSGDGSDYARAKRGAELAVVDAFGDHTLVARAGLILGPYEVTGRLPWWLERISRGGRVVAPGPRNRPLQYIDARDLADWMLDAAHRGLGGTYNAVSLPGHTTMGDLLHTCNDVTGGRADLVWLAPRHIEAAGVSGWTQLPIWTPPTGELAGLHGGDVTAVHSQGLRCRPMPETVFDTWQWLQADGYPPPVSGRGELGLDADAEKRLLATVLSR